MSANPLPKPFPGPDAQFWENCYQTGNTIWDRQAPNPQLESWIRTGHLLPVVDSDARPGSNDDARVTRVLIPGCGAGYEVVLLAEWGFDVLGLDYAPSAIAQARNLLRQLLASKVGGGVVRAEVLQADLFEFSPGVAYDAVYDQQCLVALHPSRWPAYAARLHTWLRPGGQLFFVLDQSLSDAVAASQLAAGKPRRGPPYDCSVAQLREVFASPDWIWPEAGQMPLPNAQGQLGLVLARC